ncbi:MAG TPA: phospholipase D-like domain-containing protein [Actinopolymorphaceae bacterium]
METRSRSRGWPRDGRVVLVTAVLLVVAGLFPAAPVWAVGGDARTADVGAYTVFNRPTPGSPDLAIENHIIELIDGAPAGSSIHGAMFSWTRTPVAEAIRRAQARGVDVHLAVDREGSGGVNADPTNAAVDILKAANLTQLVWCGNTSIGNSACIGNRSNSINHNKVFTFSATGDKTDLVFVGSQNWTNSQNENYNNAVVIHGDPELYGYFQRYLGDLLAQRRDNNYGASANGYFRADTSSVRGYFSPRADSSGGTGAEASTDIVAKRLTWITEYESGCTVDVAQAIFTGPRAPVADELIRIGRLGCKVRVTGDMSDYIYDRLSGQPNISIRKIAKMHSKYILYHGNYNDKPGRTLLFTGSHNLSGPALRAHDETLIRVERPEVTSAYKENFEMIWAAAG